MVRFDFNWPDFLSAGFWRRVLDRRRRRWLIPRAGFGALLIAIIFPAHELAANRAKAVHHDLWPPDWVWMAGVFVLVGLEAYLIQRDAISRDDVVERQENRLAIMQGQIEADAIIAHLQAEMPLREVAVVYATNANAKALLKLAEELFDFARARLALQPPLLTRKDRVYDDNASQAWVETIVLLHNRFEKRIKDARKLLSDNGVQGRVYEQALFDGPLTPGNILRLADFLSSSAVSMVSKRTMI